MSINCKVFPHAFKVTDAIYPDIQPGSTIQDVIDQHVKHGRAFVIHNDEITTDYSRILGYDDRLTIRSVPAGADDAARSQSSGAVQKLGVWTMAAASVLFVAGFFTGGATWVASGFLFAGGMGIGVLGAALSPDATFGMGGASGAESAPKQSPNIRGGRNQTAPWGKIPVILGAHLITPFYAAKPYTTIGGTNGVDLYLHQLFVVGHTNLLLSDIKLGESLLASNSGLVTDDAFVGDGIFTSIIEIHNGGTNSGVYPAVSNEDNPNIEIKYLATPLDQWYTTPPGTTATDLTVTYPYGIFSYDANGVIGKAYPKVLVKRRVAGSGTAWASADTVVEFDNGAAGPLKTTMRYMHTDSTAAGQYEYAMRWNTVEVPTDFRGSVKVSWSAMRCYKVGVPAIPPAVAARYTVLSMRIKATENLQGVIDQVNCIAESYTPVYDGAGSGADDWASSGYSQNPASLFIYALRGAANTRPVADASIDWPRIEAWYTTCATKGWTCNAVIANGSRLRDVLNQIASTGRAALTIRDGLYSVVVDEAKTDTVQHFTPRNTRNFTWSKAFPEKPHALKINFINAADGYASNERIVYATGYTSANATIFQQVTLWGITSEDLAWKQARYLMAVAQLRPEAFSFETDAESIVCEPGDLVRLSHDAMLVGLRSGRVKSVTVDGGDDVDTITVDELITIEAAITYAVRVRTSDGTSLYSEITNAASETHTLTLATPMTTHPAAGDIFIFGEAGIETIECIVGAIEQGDDLSCRVYLAPEAPGVHTADSGVIPAYESFVSRPPILATPAGPPTSITQAVDNLVSESVLVPIVTDATNDAASAAVVAASAPRYLGRYSAAHPTTYNPGDWWTVYDTNDTPITRGVWWSDDGTPARITTASSMTLQAKLVEALPDVAWAEEQGTYGTAADYGIETLFASLGVVTAFINSLFAKTIKVLTGGSVRGGDRFAADGSVASATDAGFYLGADGAFKSASANGSGFAVDPATGAAFNGIDLQLGDSDLITTDAESNTLTQELSRHVWKDALGAEKGRIGIEAGNNLVTSDRIYKQVTVPSSVANGDVLNYTTDNFSCHYYKGNIYIIPVGANKVQIYNISTNTMTDGATLGNYATRIMSVIYEGKIYLISSGALPIEVYDIASDTVVEKSTLGEYNRYTVQLYNGVLYIPSTLDTVMEIYDIISDTIRETTIGNKRRYTSHIHNNKMYMPTSESTTLEIYDLVNDTVSSGVAIGNYVRVTSVLTNGKIYLIEDGGTHLEIYDIATNTVATHSILGSYNRSLSNLYSNKIYMPRSGGTSFEIYDIALNTVSAGVTLANRLRYCSVQNAGKLYLPQSNGTGLEIVTIGEYDELGAGIIDRGSNANGIYVKFSDGTMMCRYNHASTVTTSSSDAQNGYYNSVALTFPAAFLTGTKPSVSPAHELSAGAQVVCAAYAITNTTLTLFLGGYTATNAAYPGYVAWGYWK